MGFIPKVPLDFTDGLCERTIIFLDKKVDMGWIWPTRASTTFSVGLGLLGLDHKIMEIYPDKMHAKNLVEEAAALKLGRGWPGESPHKEELGLVARKQDSAFARHDGAEDDQGSIG